MTKILFVCKQTNDRVTPQRLPSILGVIESYPTIVLPKLSGLPGVTLVLVGRLISTPSSRLALNMEVVDGTAQRGSANHLQVYSGLLDGVNIGPPTRSRVTPSNPLSFGNTIVG